MRVFGIDPGSRFMGVGIVEEGRGRPRHVHHAVIRVDPRSPLESRLKALHAALGDALSVHRPDAVAVEGVFTFRNARSALILGHARGVALLVAAQAGLPVHEYSPAQVKRAVGAGGAAAKDAVARMVQQLLGISTAARADATDALAVALCHLSQSRHPLAGWVSPGRSRGQGPAAAYGARVSPSYRRPARAVVEEP